MANKYLATYLNDHLAGSVAAIELLEHLEAAYADVEIARFFAELQGNIAAERRELHGLMDRLQIAESRPRKVSAWLTEKFTELKLRLDDSARGPLRLLESLEVLGLGIHGKLALWRALYPPPMSLPSSRATSPMNAWRNERRSSVAWRWFGRKLPRQLSRQRASSHDLSEIGP